MTGPLVDGVLFDIDDTLVDTQQAFAAALADVARRYLPHLDEQRHPEVLTTWRADVGGHYRAYTRGEVGYLEQRMARANALHSEFGGPLLDEDGYREWNAVFEQGFARAWAAHPDAVPVVERLLAAGLAVGALTNAAVAYQTTKLARAGLAHVPVLVGVDTFGVGKPDPRVFTEACRLLGTAPERTAYVGDELDIDARAAVAVGLLGVWVDRPGGRRTEIPDADVAAARDAGVRVVASLGELPALLGL
ncbi:HAD family hydrolase [Actinotalea fermentans]|uniref:Hydrolase n=1 Tax=Actinotalea fermentans TaxID=43671 RepID=A0A511YTE8_9CELL|nr:HAD family hydrolase [Actinotalea fermentans]KGM17341.1 haloacid dehalogenase [Actinotalea fermentans ATCC 43279 = JCM 9966 = DSM 3133]GEN78459.1 hydrolase [Actinotalea fermentans]